MPTQRLSMRRIREVLRLRYQGLTERVIARTLGVSNGVVHGYVRRARLAGLAWPLPESIDDEGLELLLFPAPTAASQHDRRPAPDWVYVEKELRRRSVTRLLLWEEYRAAGPADQTHGRACAALAIATLASRRFRRRVALSKE